MLVSDKEFEQDGHTYILRCLQAALQSQHHHIFLLGQQQPVQRERFHGRGHRLWKER